MSSAAVSMPSAMIERAGLGREADERRDERSLDRVRVDVAGEADVELDEVGRQLEDVAEAGEARAGVVDREAVRPRPRSWLIVASSAR